MQWRDSNNEEHEIIKYKIRPQQRLTILGMSFFSLLFLVPIPLNISTQIKKKSIGFTIFSSIMDLVFIFFVLLGLSVVLDAVKTLRYIKRREYQVADGFITKLRKIPQGRASWSTYAKITFSDGEKKEYEAKSYKKCKLRENAKILLVGFPQAPKLDPDVVPLPDTEE